MTKNFHTDDRGESVQPVVGGQVPGMLSTSHTLDLPKGWVIAYDQARRQPAASEPGPLAGEGEQKEEASSSATESDEECVAETAWERIADGIQYFLFWVGLGLGAALAMYGCSHIKPADSRDGTRSVAPPALDASPANEKLSEGAP